MKYHILIYIIWSKYTIKKGEKMKRIIACPYCNIRQPVKFVSTEERIDIMCECINPKCKKKYIIPLNYKKIFLSRTFSVSDSKYKYPRQVKDHHSGVIILIDLLDYESRLKTESNEIEVNEMIIEESDILVAYIHQPTFGTVFEMSYARYCKIPIYLIDANRMWTNDPWIKHVVLKTFDNIDECFQYIIDGLVKEYNNSKKYFISPIDATGRLYTRYEERKI